MQINNAQRFVFSSLLLVLAIEFGAFAKFKKIWDLAFTRGGGHSFGTFGNQETATGGQSFGPFASTRPPTATPGSRPILTI